MSERTLQVERIERVIVRGVNWVGDAVMTIPALRELRRVLPAAHITLATRAWAEGIFADADFIDELLPLDWQLGGVPAFLQQVRAWRNGSFDLALLLPNAFAPAFIAAAARVPIRVGYATDARRLLLTHPLAVPAWRGQRHEVFYYLNLVGELERHLTGASQVDLVRTPRFDLQVSFDRREGARDILGRLGVEFDAEGERPTRPLVALCPGSTNSRAKRWPAERYAALADRLMDEAGADCLLVGASEELDVTEEVCARMRRTPLVLTGRTTLAETVAVLSFVNLLVSNDTGPAHVAAALARPVLVIFGPTDPVTTRPFSDTAHVIRQPPACAPCMLRDCPIDHRCMTAITPDELFTRAAQILDEHAPPHKHRTHAEDERDRAKDVRERAQNVREYAKDVREEAKDVREHAQNVHDDALNMRDGALDVRAGVQNERERVQNVRERAQNVREGAQKLWEGALDVREGALFEHTGAEVEG